MSDVILVLSLVAIIMLLLLAFDFLGFGALLLLFAIALPVIFPIKPAPDAHGG